MNRFLARLYSIIFVIYVKRFFSIQLIYYALFGLALMLYYLLPFEWTVLTITTLYIVATILHRKAKRDGYIRFKQNKSWQPIKTTPLLQPNEKISLMVTGRLATSTQEGLLTHFPATYWHSKRNDHIIMAQVRTDPNRFLYQFINPDNIHKLKAGTLFYQTEKHSALYLSYDTEWLANNQSVEPVYYSKDAPRPNYKRIELYLTFSKPTDQTAVWSALQKKTEA